MIIKEVSMFRNVVATPLAFVLSLSMALAQTVRA
jgi:hypothetical protein